MIEKIIGLITILCLGILVFMRNDNSNEETLKSYFWLAGVLSICGILVTIIKLVGLW